MLTPTKRTVRLVIVMCSLAIAALWLVGSRVPPALAQGAATGYKNFEGPQVHPLAITPDGTHLLACNTPNGTLSVFYVTGSGLTLMAEIPVGLEPVSVIARNNGEVWVANWLSDSVSVVDLNKFRVTRTFDVGDEPTDLLFAGQQKELAFVCVSGLSQVKVFDPNSPAAAPQVINIRGKQPRALARDSAGAQVFVSVFESGNQTTVVSAAQVASAGGPPPPSPALAAGLPAPPGVGLIVKWNGSAWADETNNTRWNSLIPYTLADIDVVVIDAHTATPAVSTQVRGVGTHIGNAVFDATANRLLVINDDARNNVRFEPNVRGRFLASRVSSISLNGTPAVTASDLNSHINLNNPAGSDSERALSLALPADIARGADGTLYVAATGSAKVGVLDSQGAVQTRIAVGQGPTGLTLNSTRNLLYVLNRFDETVGIIDLVSQMQTTTVPVGFNPEPNAVTNGRRFLYDATLSAHGDLACASCHQNGHRDGLAWDLGDPQGQVATVSNPLGALLGFPIQSQFHPMKGPMTTQSLRGISGTEPLHWRGDRAALASFNPAFQSLLGGPRQLTTDEMNAYTAFVQTLTYPPNPNENLDRTLPNPATGANATRGAQLFNNTAFDQNILTCNVCHTATPGFGPGTAKVIIPGTALQESQDFKVPQLRGEYQKLGLVNAPGEQLSGFGFIHDGSTDSLFDFLHAPVFTFQNDNQRRDIEQFVLAFDTGTAPAVGLQVTVDSTNSTTPTVTDRINLLIAQANAGNCDLIVKGIYNGALRSFWYAGGGAFQPDKQSDAQVLSATLLQSASAGAQLTFFGVPPGAGRRMSIDRNGNNILDGDEPPTPNALDAAQFFVWQHYLDFLNREPDQAGLDYWSGQIAVCGNNLACINQQRIGVSAAFFIELEFQQTGSAVYRLYRAAYGTVAGAPTRANVTFSQFISDRSQLVGGSDLSQSTLSLANDFVSRPQFKQAYGDSLAAGDFVNKLFDTAGLVPYTQQRQDDTSALSSGAKTRAQVLLEVIDIQEFKDREYNPSFVLMQYFGYLRRDPDQGGYDFWLNVLNNQQPNNFRGMVCSFLTSAEYQLRFGWSVTRTNHDCQ